MAKLLNEERSEKLRQFLKDRPALSAACMENEAQIRNQSIAWVKKGRNLNEEYWPKLMPILKKYGWK